MLELDVVLLAKTVFPFILGIGVFHCFLRISMRILRGDCCFYISREKPEEKPEEKLEEKPESFDIPEKQTDFIQLN